MRVSAAVILSDSSFVVNETPPTVRQFSRLVFWVGKGSKIRLETLKTLENTGLFRFVVIICSIFAEMVIC